MEYRAGHERTSWWVMMNHKTIDEVMSSSRVPGFEAASDSI